MLSPRFIPVVAKQVWRHRTRSLLTALGVAIAMFLFIAVQSLQQGVHDATTLTASDTTLIVYRANRFCPATSRLPEYFEDRIMRIPGVTDAIPMKIVVSNCRASLDVITFRGMPPDDLPAMSAKWTILEGSLEEWKKRSDAAMVGERLARRRKFQIGQSFDSSGVAVTIAGIIRSDEPQDENVAYVHLPFLQRASRQGLGLVTQFNVRVDDPVHLEPVAKAIDEEFRSEQDPTQTRPEKAFVAQAGADIVGIVGFTKYLGWGALAAVLALIANAIVLSVQDRIKEHAVLQTLGFRGSLIARLIIAEGVLIALIGGALGTAAAIAGVSLGNLSLSNEGLSINIHADWQVAAIGLALSAAVGVIAGLLPAWQASRREIAQCFRAV